MARISLLSLDQEQSDDEAITDIEVLDSISQAEQGTSQSDVVNQAIDDHEQLGRLAEIVNNSGQGVDENTAEVVELAVESIRIRCGFKKPFKVSTESFSKSSTRAQASTVLVQNIQSIQERLGKNIAVAQEGMIDDIKFRLSNMFTSTKGLRKRLVEAGTRYDNRGAKDAHVQIKCGGWGNRLNRDGKNILDGGIAVKYMAEAEKIITNSKFIEFVTTSTKWMEQVEESVRDCWFFSSRKATDDILDVVDEADKYIEKLKSETTTIHRFKNNEAYAKALGKSEKEKLQVLAEECLSNNSLSKAIDRYCEASSNTQLWMIINSVFFRAGGFAGAAMTMVPIAGHVVGSMVHSDMRAAYKALRRIYDLVNEIYNVIVLRDHICLAAVKYIEESTLTGRS